MDFSFIFQPQSNHVKHKNFLATDYYRSIILLHLKKVIWKSSGVKKVIWKLSGVKSYLVCHCVIGAVIVGMKVFLHVKPLVKEN